MASFIDREEAELGKTGKQLIRLAMIHHPMAYPGTPPDQPDWKPEPLRGLINMGEVQAMLQALGFFGVLCGHQHDGFVHAVLPDPTRPPLHVFSCGTSTQKVSLSKKERRLLRGTPVTAEDIEERGTALSKLNEFVTYELRRSANGYFWSSRAHRLMPHLLNYTSQPEADEVPVTFATLDRAN